jgi:hypothetical protein
MYHVGFAPKSYVLSFVRPQNFGYMATQSLFYFLYTSNGIEGGMEYLE